MSFVLILKLLHVLSAFWFIGGLLGRQVCLAQAGRTREFPVFLSLLSLSGRFEERFLIPGQLAVLAFGLLTAWQQGQPLLGVLQGASANWLFVSLLLFLSSIPLVVLVFLPRGRRFAELLEAARARGEVTPELSAGLQDPVVALAHGYELLSVLVIIILMVTKPF